MRVKFKDSKLDNLIISLGDCYTIKKEYESKLKDPFQKVVFAITIVDNKLSELKDLSPNLIFETTSDKELKLEEGKVITTSATTYKTEESFFKYYMKTSEKISEFMEEYEESRKNKNTKQSKPVARPRRR